MKKLINFRLDASQFAELEELRWRKRISSMSELLRELVELGLEEMKRKEHK